MTMRSIVGAFGWGLVHIAAPTPTLPRKREREQAARGERLRTLQRILKIASASTACAKNPTVKASVRKIGRPMV